MTLSSCCSSTSGDAAMGLQSEFAELTVQRTIVQQGMRSTLLLAAYVLLRAIKSDKCDVLSGATHIPPAIYQ